MTTHSAPLTFSPEIMAARANGSPIVALESTIITHGMPFPQNVQTALRVEAEVRAHGATPATIARTTISTIVDTTHSIASDCYIGATVAQFKRAFEPNAVDAEQSSLAEAVTAM